MGADLELGTTVDTDVMVDDEVSDDDSGRISPLFQAPYTTNRFRFAIVAITLVLINSLSLHRWVARHIIEIPTDEFNITSVYSRHMNKTKEYSDAFVGEVEDYHEELRERVNETLASETSRVGALRVLNADILQMQLREENDIRLKNDAMVSYLKAWTRVGNIIPYYPTVSDEDQLFLEQSLQLENGAFVKDLAEQSVKITESIAAHWAYDQEYFLNKTAGLVPTLIPTLSATLQIPDLEDDIRAAVRVTHDQVVARLKDAREYFGNIYDALTQRLDDTQLGLEQMGEAYRELLQTVRQFYNILDSINVIGLNVNAFPRIDIDSFPSPEFFKPDIIVFPTTPEFLLSLDIILDLIDTDFDNLQLDILDRLQIQIDLNAGEIISEVVDALTPDDYNPPPIYNYKDGTILSPSEALMLNAEITTNLTSQAIKATPSLPMSDEVPSIQYPDIMLQYSSFDFVQQTKELFPWKIANLDYVVPPFVSTVFLLIWMYWSYVELYFWKVWSSFKTASAYFEGTVISEPVLDIRTKAEQRHRKNLKKGKWRLLASVIYHPMVAPMARRLLFCVIATMIVVFGRSYFFQEFEKSCILSNNGTGTGHATILPWTQTLALTDGIQRANDLNLQNHLYMQQQCQARVIHTYEAYQRQDFERNNTKARIEFYAFRIQDIRQQVDMGALCQHHQLACQVGDPEFDCPTLEDGSIVENPCSFSAADTDISDAALHDIEYGCTFEPSYTVIVDDRRERLNEELEVQENWCLVEWWVIGHVWRALYVLVGFALLHNAFVLIQDGLIRFHWTRLIPEKYRSNCTTDVEGGFTQPEYSDPEEWKRASMGYKRTKNWYAGLSIWAGFLLLVVYGLLTMRIDHVSKAPVWFDIFRQETP